MLASLRHPNIVQFMGLVTLPACIITEFCSRGSLTDVIREGKASAEGLPWARRLDMVTAGRQRLVTVHVLSCTVCHAASRWYHGLKFASIASLPNCRCWAPPRECCSCMQAPPSSCTGVQCVCEEEGASANMSGAPSCVQHTYCLGP